MDRLQFQRSYYPAPHMAAVPFAWPSSVGCQYAFSVPMSSYPTPSPSSGQAYWPQFPGAYILGEQLKVPGESKFQNLESYADDSNLSDDTNQSRKRRRSITSGDSSDTCEYDDDKPAAALNPACSGQSEGRTAPLTACDSADSDDTDCEDLAQQDIMCAEVLQLLRSGSWEENLQPERTANIGSTRPNKKCRTNGAARRTYTWRSLHHRNKSEDGSGHVEKAKAVVAPAEEDCQHSQGLPTSSHKEQDKEWAALTTWLRMNLHQLRTSKRQVLFTADSPAPGQPWVFQLNPNLTWDDINEDTKLRLKTLPEETEAAYARKYPKRPSSEWQRKTQKYRPQGSSSTVQVPLGEMVSTLSRIYFVQEGHQQQ